MLALPDLLQKCRERGVKLTPQRIAIFEYLAERDGHPSAEEVYQQVSRRHPTISFATVYNTLQLLTELGEVREIIIDELRRRYDVNTEPHQHALCRRCHRILDIRLDVQRLLGELDLREYDFTVESATVAFRGLCGDCLRTG